MNFEKKTVKLLYCNTDIKTTYLFIYDDVEGDEDSVVLEIEVNKKKFRGQSDNYFDALKELRKCLERENVKIMCNGAGRNVYPSPMAFSMGNTRKAYKTYPGKQSFVKDLVDIFECEQGLEFVSIDEQTKFNKEWIESFKKFSS